ncbi:MAG: hypothetical protein H0Z29_10755 [Candidatus Marinimicrobia bacterium]|nr:hypothetical protein [Candidatus Neomarinimicrobiota bacterium]
MVIFRGASKIVKEMISICNRMVIFIEQYEFHQFVNEGDESLYLYFHV